MSKKVLVAGASGNVGSAAVDAFLREGWEVVALSRRKPEVADPRDFEHVRVDLLDADASRRALGALTGVTHVVFAALSEKPGLIAGWNDPAQMDINLKMLQNCLEPLTSGAGAVEHVSIMQGTKAYGLHLHPIPIPARESAPRDPHPNFYWLQEDYLKEQAERLGFAYTILRPQMVVGGAYGAAMNVAPVLAAYAAICREENEPFGFPGGAPFVWEASDARLVANVLVWATTAPTARNEHFNVTNGDVFEWRSVWPAIAETLGVDPAGDRPMALSEYLPAKSAVWDRVVEKHALRPLGLSELLGESQHITDFCFAYGATEPPPPAFVSAIKLRQAGFTEVVDTEDMFRFWLGSLIDRKIAPSP